VCPQQQESQPDPTQQQLLTLGQPPAGNL